MWELVPHIGTDIGLGPTDVGNRCGGGAGHIGTDVAFRRPMSVTDVEGLGSHR